jgi:hypothetical protein
LKKLNAWLCRMRNYWATRTEVRGSGTSITSGGKWYSVNMYVMFSQTAVLANDQELASTRHLLNNANDRIRALENEILAYRTISPDLGLGQSRTRVVRRQPEGSHLTASTSTGARQVSASGPGARRFL